MTVFEKVYPVRKINKLGFLIVSWITQELSKADFFFPSV